MLKSIALSALLGTAVAQLVLNTNKQRLDQFLNRNQPLIHAVSEGQKPLTYAHTNSEVPAFKAGQFTKKLQDNETCPTYGEAQYTGTIDVTDTHRLFYWYFDSRNDPENDPIILWMNGGPGGSSLLGLFNEMGPCWLDAKTDIPEPNKWAWNNNASLIFLDQPAGVGFSSRAEGVPPPAGDMDGAEDFQQFLNIFFDKVFPEKKKLPLHIAAESYGGHYGPVYVDHILNSRRWNSKNAFWGKIASMILVDAVLDFSGLSVGVYELLCEDVEKTNILNHTSCEKIAHNLPELQRLGVSCDLTYDGRECMASAAYMDGFIHKYYVELVEAGKHHMYNIHLPCPDPPECTDITKGNISHHLNLDRVKKALDMPASKVYDPINWEINTAYVDGGAAYAPTTRQVASILDAHAEDPAPADIKLLVLNGNDDYIVNTPGQILTYDNLRWSGQAEYRLKKWQKLPDGMGVTGKWKTSKDGRLAFVGVDGAGHMVPGDQREGSYHILQRWIHGQWRM